MNIERKQFNQLIKEFKFGKLFNELGWDRVKLLQNIAVKEEEFLLTGIAEKRGFVVFTCTAKSDGKIPDVNSRKKIDRDITKYHFEHLIIYTNGDNTEQIWQLSVREQNKPIQYREYTYYLHQEPELLFQKLRGLVFTLDEEEKIGLVDVKQRVSDQFEQNSEKVTKAFYTRFKTEHAAFQKFIEGIDEKADVEWYSSLMLNRLMFIYFIQKKGFLDNNPNYLREKLEFSVKKKGKDKFYKSFYRNFLLMLFHKGLGNPGHSQEIIKEIGKVPYLNGGLFDDHRIEKDYDKLDISDKAFQKLFEFFDQYNWHLDTRITATGKDINPDVIGYIFEKYINDRASMGAYYTKEDITEYISKNTILPFLFDRIKRDCANAFKEESSLWQMLRENPDRYIYDAVKHGIYEDSHSELVSESPVNSTPTGRGRNLKIRKLPEEIAIGLDTTKPDLLERRKEWNKSAPEEFALPTEIWREVVERRNRYFEIKSKLENDEIREINDFITYNLDIRQFAQDAVEKYEGSDFINAFYKAITEITILDPTCGSGAFLFAALNILEPLYEACIERMREFVQEDDENGGRKRFENFRKVLNDIEIHPNQKYYIFKSIILKNLYGVDIMNEAVEIAKLRLFLKLVAEIEPDESDENFGMEPLPDIDFNIRAGNTLIGFATKEELDKGLKWSLNIGNDTKKVYDEMDIVAKAFKRYKEIQLEDEIIHTEFKEAKDGLNLKLKKLNETLNDYLGNDYGKSKKQENEFNKWLSSYKPFHWFAEYYEIINNKNGFDVIIGNPPYVEYSKVKGDYYLKSNFETLNCGNLYAFVVERISNLINNNSHWGVILPLSAFCTQRMLPLVKLVKERYSTKWISHFGWRPATLFEGVNIPLSIVVCSSVTKSRPNLFTTDFNKWYQENRISLMENLQYSEVSNLLLLDFVIPKIGTKMNNIIAKLIGEQGKINKLITSYTTNNILYYRNTGGLYWRIITNFKPHFSMKGSKTDSSTLCQIFFNSQENLDLVTALLNSNLFWLYYVAYSSFYHVNTYDILEFPFNSSTLTSNEKKELLSLCNKLMEDLKNNSKIMRRVHKGGNVSDAQTFYPAKSKNIVDSIDMSLKNHFGYSDDEIDYIISYDFKFRNYLSFNEEEAQEKIV